MKEIKKRISSAESKDSQGTSGAPSFSFFPSHFMNKGISCTPHLDQVATGYQTHTHTHLFSFLFNIQTAIPLFHTTRTRTHTHTHTHTHTQLPNMYINFILGMSAMTVIWFTLVLFFKQFFPSMPLLRMKRNKHVLLPILLRTNILYRVYTIFTIFWFVFLVQEDWRTSHREAELSGDGIQKPLYYFETDLTL